MNPPNVRRQAGFASCHLPPACCWWMDLISLCRSQKALCYHLDSWTQIKGAVRARGRREARHSGDNYTLAKMLEQRAYFKMCHVWFCQIHISISFGVAFDLVLNCKICPKKISGPFFFFWKHINYCPGKKEEKKKSKLRGLKKKCHKSPELQ